MKQVNCDLKFSYLNFAESSISLIWESSKVKCKNHFWLIHSNMFLVPTVLDKVLG